MKYAAFDDDVLLSELAQVPSRISQVPSCVSQVPSRVSQVTKTYFSLFVTEQLFVERLIDLLIEY